MAFLLIIFISISNLDAQIVNKCQEDWKRISLATNESSGEFYLMRKYSGFLKNNLGDYESCNSLANSKYVLLRYSASPVNIQTFCGPASCEQSDYQIPNSLGLDPIYNQTSYEILFSKKIQDEKYGKFSSGALAMIVFMSFIVGLCVLAGVFEYFKLNFEGIDDLTEALLCFSIINNSKDLFKPANQTKTFRHTGFMNAFEVISIFWTILAHTFQYNYFYSVLANIDQAYETTNSLFYLIVYGGLYAVDTFFWGIGYGVTYNCLEELRKKNVPIYKTLSNIFANRYLFLSATYFFFVFFFWTLQVYLGSGPMWVDLENSVSQCDDYWFTNIIYLNIYIPNFEGHFCLLAGWYTSNDIQFLLIVLLVSWVFYKHGERVSYILLTILLILCVGVTYSVVSYHNMSATLFSAESGKDYFSFYFIKPYCRIAPCLFGIFCGLITRIYIDQNSSENEETLLLKGNSDHKISLTIAEVYQNQIVRVLSIILGFSGLIFLSLITFDIYDHPGPDDKYTHWEKSEHFLYLTFDKVAFGVSLSLILLPIALGYFPIIRNLMSSYPFIILGRLNYSAYLIHNSLIEIYYKQQKSEVIFGTWNNLTDSCFFWLLCQLFAILSVLFIEMPVINLYQRLVKQDQRLIVKV